ncbi:S8 family peptidase [Sphingomonas sp. SUN039]|uniref:S8 family peptidase n=1 Tax=Sphingomonas sp. SUN039 TaxID=2937787 RepID=UPI002164A320|nr:S8 family peptidase [Sphingomonas sp. SUN039]UVO55322.1 S8 family serine peptidase [Sphingomonas sp. SUN039]
MTLSPDRVAIAANTGDATGAMNPYERAKVHIAYGYGLSGAGVKIGIVDSGFNIVGGQPVHNEFDGTGKLVKLVSAPPIASDAHGTHVSGLAAAQRDGRVMQGVAYGATLYLGDTDTSPTGFKGIFDEFRTQGVRVSSNSYGVPIVAGSTVASPFNPVQTTATGLEVTAKNVIAYRTAQGITTEQALANIHGGTAAEWTAAIASFKAFQDAGGVIVFANSNYGANDIANGRKGLDDVDDITGLPLLAPTLQGGWIAVANGTSLGLATQANGAGDVAASTAKENNIVLNSAQCGLGANFCLTMDGTAAWSGSNTGIASYTSQTGTSQATPMVAGMLALLREAFPTASSADLAARLLFTADNKFFVNNNTVSTITTASYTNANGTITHRVSNIWGHGFPDMQVALNPVGATATVTASGVAIARSKVSGTVQLGSAFGSGGSTLASAQYLYNDQLNGVFAASLAGNVASTPENMLATTMGERMLEQSVVSGSNEKGLSFSFGQAVVPDSSGTRARIGNVFSLTQQVGVDGRVAFGSGLNVDNSLGFASRHSTLRSATVSDRAMGIPLLSLGNRPQNWAATGIDTGKFRTNFAVFSTAGSLTKREAALLTSGGRNDGFVADVVVGAPGRFQLNVSAGQMRERDAFLGSRASTAFVGGSAMSQFARVGFLAPLSSKFALQANYVTAFTSVRAATDGLFAGFSKQRTEAMALSLIADDVVTRGSRLTLGVSQPLRLASGTASLNLPQKVLIRAPGDYSYGYDTNGVNLSPSGREVRYTMDYSQRLSDTARFSLSGMAISQPGHNANARTGFAGMASLKLKF